MNPHIDTLTPGQMARWLRETGANTRAKREQRELTDIDRNLAPHVAFRLEQAAEQLETQADQLEKLTLKCDALAFLHYGPAVETPQPDESPEATVAALIADAVRYRSLRGLSRCLLSTYRSEDRVIVQCESIAHAEQALSRVMGWLLSEFEWERMFDAWIKHQAGLPSEMPLWPNPDWSQDVAMVAHALARSTETAP